MNQARVLEIAVELALAVGKRMRDVYESPVRPAMRFKQKNDPVTEIDEWADAEIKARVAAEFPEHLFIGEESAEATVREQGKGLRELAQSGVCWIVDPIDGTTNFTRRIPHSAVSIAVYDRLEAAVGVVYDPYRDELFTAERGRGAKLNGKPISVSNVQALDDALMAVGFPAGTFNSPELQRYYLPLMARAGGTRVFGSAALDLCWVACGRYDLYYQQELKPWDVAAGALIVSEAGGQAHSLSGDFSVFGNGFLFTNTAIVPSVRAELKL